MRSTIKSYYYYYSYYYEYYPINVIITQTIAFSVLSIQKSANHSSLSQNFKRPIHFWRKRRSYFHGENAFIASKFPNLRIVAAKLFSVRISSASAERLFSLAGLVCTARRNRMSANQFDCVIAYAYNDFTLRQHSSTKAEKRLSSKQQSRSFVILLLLLLFLLLFWVTDELIMQEVFVCHCRRHCKKW